MMTYITELWNKWLGSFDNQRNSGFSARKLTVFAVSMAYLYCHRWCDMSNLGTVLTIDAGLICTLLGITTWQQTKENATKKDNETN